MRLPVFEKKEDLHTYIMDNRATIMHEKKNVIQKGLNVNAQLPILDKKDDFTRKSIGSYKEENGVLLVKCIINTSNVLDAHLDVHIGNVWKKSLQETKYLLHLESHIMDFKHIISDTPDINAYVQELPWESIGYNYSGNTHALIFESKVREKRNSYMYSQYANNFVHQHSVGMNYIQLFTCINSEKKEYNNEFENWNKFYPYVVNKDYADQFGVFFAVTEAKVVEGSAVVLGSNHATPTQSVSNIEEADFSITSTQKNEPILFTPQELSVINYLDLIKIK